MPPEAQVFRVQAGARVATPLCSLAQELAALEGWRRYGLAFLLGVVAALALPPFDLTPVLVIAFPGLLWLDDGSGGPWASFRLGYAFGFGFFLAGMYWVASALFVDLDDFWWLVPFAAAGLPAYLALYSDGALWVAGFAGRRFDVIGAARICLFAIAWTAAEWVRGHALTGLPWNLIGYAWAGGFPGALTVLQATAGVGIYGLGYLTVLAAALPALLGEPSLAPLSAARCRAPAIAAAALVLFPAAFGAWRLATVPTESSATWLRLVQPSIPQSFKWQPDLAEADFKRLLALSTPAASHSLEAIVWPEAAVPFLLGRDGAHRAAVASVAPKSGYVLTGALRANPPPGPVEQVWNSILAVNGKGDIVASYDKAHLVPFGEYVPLRRWLPFVKKVTAGMIDLSPGVGPKTIALPGLPAFAPFICYEAIFPGAIVDPEHRPAWLLNVTNDAWYGRSSGPYQHFAIARTRAVEEGLPLVRAANNGISGVVDPVGRVVARLDLDAVGYADIALPAALPTTPYARLGDWLLLPLLLIGALPVLARLR